MQIVLEGCDCSGKSTLANQLEFYMKVEFNIKEVRREHEGLPPDVPSLFEHYAVKALTYPFCIHDRLHLGERTYGPIKRNQDNLGPVGQHIIDHIIRSHGFGVICIAPLRDVINCWKKRREREYLQEMGELVQVYHAYRDKSLRCDDAWDIINPFQSTDVLRLKDRIEYMAEETYRIPYDHGIGPCTASTLIVGEMSNHRIYDLPFFSTNGSSGYLIKTLIELGIGHDYFVTNALRKDGKPRDLLDIVRRLKDIRRVIGLGRVACVELTNQEIPHLSLPHPQFYYRFKHHHEVDYLNLFKIAMEADHAAKLRVL